MARSRRLTARRWTTVQAVAKCCSTPRQALQYKALADPNRLHLVLLLADGPRTVRQLTDAAGMSQTLVSHYLAPLREQGLVTITPRVAATSAIVRHTPTGGTPAALTTVLHPRTRTPAAPTSATRLVGSTLNPCFPHRVQDPNTLTA